MLKFSSTQKRRTAAFAAVLLLAVLGNFPKLNDFHSCSAFFYMGFILAWALTVNSRILQPLIRRLFLYSCGFMILIFVLRIMRYDIFPEFLRLGEYMIYMYGVCYSMVALISFLAALCVGREEADLPLRHTLALWIAETLLCIAMLTNPLHHLFYEFKPGTIDIKVHGPLYFLMIIWCAVFAIATIVVIMVRRSSSASRRYWFIPAGAMAFGVLLLVWYFVIGGAPKIGPYKLFNVQEAFCLTAILPFEALFLIGLIPTNSDYDLFFRNSSIKAAILDKEGAPVLMSPSYSPQKHEGERLQQAEISKGSVVWTEDISELLRLRRELTELNEALAEENELIKEENRLQEERIAFETRNRLYDSISETLRPQMEAMKGLLGEGSSDSDDDFSGRLEYAMLMGAYIKRMGNLMLLGDGKRTLPSGELALSINESFEYMRLGGMACSLDGPQLEELPVPQLLLCYRLFEHIAEQNYADIHAISVQLLPEDGILMRMALDCPRLKGAGDEELSALAKALGFAISVRFEDDTWFAELGNAPLAEPADKQERRPCDD